MQQTINGDFIAGFVAGEGCFSLNYRYGKNESKRYIRPLFSINLDKRDKELLKTIKQFLQCGSIYEEQTTNCWTFRVYNCWELQNIIISFFEKYQLHGHKQKVFEVFKQAMKIIYSKQHLTEEGYQNLKKLRTKIKYLNGGNSNHNFIKV